jgi:hypothetical protein
VRAPGERRDRSVLVQVERSLCVTPLGRCCDAPQHDVELVAVGDLRIRESGRSAAGTSSNRSDGSL